MKRHRLPFKGYMVRRILSGDKTQTRRLEARWKPGDIICVTEVFAYWEGGIAYRADGQWIVGVGEEPWHPDVPHEIDKLKLWKSPRFMPYWAVRANLEVLEVRSEPLQEISRADCFAEGIYELTTNAYTYSESADLFLTPQRAFHALWESIHGQGAWAGNPVVPVTTFKRIAT